MAVRLEEVEGWHVNINLDTNSAMCPSIIFGFVFIKVLLNNLKKTSGKLRLLKTSRMRASSSTCAECELMAGTMFEDSGGVVWGCIGVDVVSLLFSLFFGYKIDKIQIQDNTRQLI